MPPRSYQSLYERLARISGEKIIEGLNNSDSPLRPLVPVALDDFLRAVDGLCADDQYRRRSLITRPKHGDVLDAFALFANSIWTEEEKSKLEAYWEEPGRPDTALFIMMKRIKGKAPTRLQEIAYGVFGELCAVSDEMLPTTRTTLKLERKEGKRGKWPSSPSKFIPFGAERAVTAFIKWASIMENIIPIGVLAHLTSFCPSLIPVIVQDKELLPVTTRLLRRTLEVLKGPNAPRQGEPGHKWIQQELSHYQGLFKCTWLQDQLAAYDGSYARRNLTTLVPLYFSVSELLPHVRTATVGLPKYHRDSFENVFLVFALHIMTASNLTIVPLPMHPCLAPYVVKTGDPSVSCNFQKLIAAAYDLRSQRKCTEKGCSQTGEETKTNLKFCTACRVARYCSRPCQSADWKEHKQVCKSLKAMVYTYDRRDTIIPPKAVEAGELTSAMIDEKLKVASGLNEDEISHVEKYVGERAVTLRAKKKAASNPEESTPKTDIILSEALALLDKKR